MTGGSPGGIAEFHRQASDLRLLTVHPVVAHTSSAPVTGTESFEDVLPEGSRMRGLSAESLRHLPRLVSCLRHDALPAPSGDDTPRAPNVVARWSIQMQTEMGQTFALDAWDADIAGPHVDAAATIGALRHAKRRAFRDQPLFHEMLVIQEGPLLDDLGLLGDGGRSIVLDSVDRVMTPESQQNRPEYRLTTLPGAPNRHLGTVAAVQPRSSVWAGQAPDYLFAVACSIGGQLVALELLRLIREEALDALRTFRADDHSRETLRARLHDLERLRLDISFGVEANLPNRFTAPTQPVYELAAHFADALGVSSAAATTHRMVEHLNEAIDTRESRLAAEEAAEAETRRAAWGAIALLAIPATLWLGFLGANVRQTGPDGRPISIWGTTSLLYLAGFVALAGICAVALPALARRRSTSA